MKAILLILALLGPALPAAGQDSAQTGERSRISAGRAEAEAVFKASEQACYSRFAVNDCIEVARAQRRQALAGLRRQENQLNDAERKRKADERLRELQERESQRPAPRSIPPLAPASDAASPPAPRSQLPRQPQAVRQPQPVRSRAPSPAPAPDMRENVRRHQARLEEAQEHRGKVEARATGRKAPARALPVPP